MEQQLILQYIYLALISPTLPLLIGYTLDRWLGDPSWFPHPVIGFGWLISFGEKRLNKGRHRMLKGGVMAVVLVLFTYLLAVVLFRFSDRFSTYLTANLEALFIFACLAGTTLVHEVRRVFQATARSLAEGRQQLARLVGRDTSGLSLNQVRTAALETLAENLSDGVIAPLFWYAVLGVPGMLAYKMINTLDSMIGYKNDRYLYFGRVAARLDDVANYIPARLTALLMIIIAGGRSTFRFVRKYGNQHLSPNSGYPEAALASILDCRFGGPQSYFGKVIQKPFIGDHFRLLDTFDLRKSVLISRCVEAFMVLLVIIVLILSKYAA